MKIFFLKKIIVTTTHNFICCIFNKSIYDLICLLITQKIHLFISSDTEELSEILEQITARRTIGVRFKKTRHLLFFLHMVFHDELRE